MGDTNKKYSIKERSWILKQYYQLGSAEKVRSQWRKIYRGINPPSRNAIYSIREKFERTGSVADDQRSGRTSSTCNEENQMKVAMTFTEQPMLSIRRASLELNIPATCIQKMLKASGFKAFHPAIVQELLPGDPEKRLEFCATVLDQIKDVGIQFLDSIIWTDEASFKLSGVVNNRRNTVFWAHESPHHAIEKRLNQPGLTVWAGISSHGIIGPIFFNETINGERYSITPYRT